MSATKETSSNHGLNLSHQCSGFDNNFKKCKIRLYNLLIFLINKTDNSRSWQEVREENLNI